MATTKQRAAARKNVPAHSFGRAEAALALEPANSPHAAA
jgi:hypothetical protein